MPDKSWTEVMSEANKKVEELNNDYETECLRKKVSCHDVILLSDAAHSAREQCTLSSKIRREGTPPLHPAHKLTHPDECSVFLS